MRMGSPLWHCSGRVPYPLKTPKTWSQEGPVPHTGGSRNATSVEETQKSSMHTSSCAGPSGDWDEAFLSPFKGRGEAKERRVKKKHEHQAQPIFSFKTFLTERTQKTTKSRGRKEVARMGSCHGQGCRCRRRCSRSSCRGRD